MVSGIMSLLSDHFERVRQHEAQGLPLTRGVFYDVGWTLIRQGINQPLVDFALWNNTRKIIGDNHVFSSDVPDAQRMLDKDRLNLADFGVSALIYKQATYNQAFSKQHKYNLGLIQNLSDDAKKAFVPQPAHCLELVIDDQEPKEGVMKATLALTWWHPDDKAVQEFLEKREYLAFIR
jgi:hypothetical protein